MNVLIVDDHSIVLNGLRSLLKNELLKATVSEASSVYKAYQLIRDINYKLAILDLKIGDEICFNLIEQIHILQPCCNVLVYSTFREEVFAFRIYKLGAKGYINKSASISELKAAINSMVMGNIFYSEKTKEIMLDKIHNPRSSGSLDALSNRELEVTMLLLKGKGLKQITNELNVSKSTASTFKRRIFSKLRLNNVMELSELCLANGLG